MSEKNRILLVGGGSGGHLTPLVAIAESIKLKQPECIVCYVGQKDEDLTEVTNNPIFDESHAIQAGKFRRYHGESLVRQLFDIKTMLLNIRDLGRFVRGTFQAYFLLRRLKPTAVFLKGGFVSVPVGFAARATHTWYMTHDSDAIPGLANRMTASHAAVNATALPIDGYPYERTKAVQVGIPLQKDFVFVTEKMKKQAKRQLEIPEDAQVVLSVGGGLGAQIVNKAVVRASKKLLEENPRLVIMHLTGKKLYAETETNYTNTLMPAMLERIKIIDFSTTLHQLSAASDVVITRVGATNIAEFAAQSKPVIAIPAPHLTGGQQLHNAKVLERANAAVILHEDSLGSLAKTTQLLLDNMVRRSQLSAAIHKLAVYDADERIADLLLDNSQQTT